MPAFDRILHSDIIGQVWRRILLKFREGKLAQLMTLKPIQVYNEEMPYELDGAHLEVQIEAHLENIIQKPIQRAFDILSMDFKGIGEGILNYTVSVDVEVKMDYENMGIYLRNQYANQQHRILDDQIGLTFHDFILKNKGDLLEVTIPMKIDARYKILKYSGEIEILAKGRIEYDHTTYMISVVDISYTVITESWVFRIANVLYYRDIVNALEEFLQFNIRDELDSGLAMLQEKVEEYNDEFTFLSGKVKALDLNKIEMFPEEAVGTFHVDGRIRLLRP